MDRKLGIFVFLTGLFVASLFVGAETESASVEKNDFSSFRDGNGLDVYFFYGRGCPHCARVEPFLAEMKQKYLLRFHSYDIYNNRSCLSLFDEYCNTYGLPLKRRGVPTVFVSHTYFVGDSPILKGFEEVVKKALQEENSSTDQALDTDSSEGLDQEIISMGGGLSIVTVTVAALVDAISPCSIAILVFLVGARVLVADRRKKALKVGLAFCLSVFIAYLLFGLGLFTIMQLSGFSGIFSLLVGLVAVLAGIFYLKDVFWYGGGGFVMEVPRSLKPLLMKMLKGVTSPFGAFVMGFVVCLFELPCTGGPYLFILGQLANTATRLQTVPLLLYYNFIFVLPLIIISLLLYSNLFSLGKVREWNDKNKRLLKLVGGFVMMAMGFLVIPISQMFQFMQSFLQCFKAIGPPVIAIIFLYSFASFAKQKNLGNKITRLPARSSLLLSLMVVTVFIGPGSTNLLLGRSSCVSASSCKRARIDLLIEDALESGKLAFLFFYMDGCPWCNKQQLVINELERNFFNDVDFIRVNSEKNLEATREFQVDAFPSMFLIYGKDERGYLYEDFGGYTEIDLLRKALMRYVDVPSEALTSNKLSLENTSFADEFKRQVRSQDAKLESPRAPAVLAFPNVEPEILEELTEKTEVTVIVKLKDIDLPYKDLPELRRKIKENQDNVLSILADDFNLSYRYEVLNAFAGGINKNGLEKLKNNPLVEAVYINRILHTTLPESVPLINADDVWQIKDSGGLNITGKGQTVCVIDTGVDYTHPDLGGCLGSGCKVLGGVDFINLDNDPMDDNGHGTHVAGIVAANGGIKGVAPDAKIVAIKVCDATGCPGVAMAAGMDWCINHKDEYSISVITMSIGDSGEYDESNCPTWMDFSVDMAYNADIPVTIASGNEGHSNGISYPACSPHAISVGATYDADVGSQTWCLNPPACTQTCTDSTTAADQVVCFTNSDEILDLLAPGAMINSTALGGGFATKAGTSMATPHVAGTIALLKQFLPNIGPDNVEYILKISGVDVTDSKNGLTFPRMDALEAISSSCEYPTDGMDITKDTTFCPGTYYLPSGITIKANDIVLDCNGAELVHTGTGTADGISNQMYDDIVIKNCNVKNYRYGIILGCYSNNPAASNIAENNDLSGNQYGIYTYGCSKNNYNTMVYNTIRNSERGIYISSSKYNNVTQNSITQSTGYGIYLASSSYNDIIQNSMTHNIDYGIYLASSSYNDIIQNSMTHNIDYGIYLASSSRNDIAQNTIRNSTLYGIYLNSGSGYNNIWDNDIYDAGIWYEATYHNKYCIDGVGNRYYDGADGPTCSCIPLLDGLIVNSIETFCVRSYSLPSGIEIRGNDIVFNCNGIELMGTGSGAGIYNYDYDNVVIKNCNVENYQYGIILSRYKNDYAQYTLVENNLLSDNQYGIYTVGRYNDITKNDITRSIKYGIYLGGYYDNTTQNIITNSAEYGAYLAGSYNDVTQNTIANSTLYGIYVRSTGGYNNIWDNDIYDTGIWYEATNHNKYCFDGVGNNYYNGAEGPTCSCIPLLDDLIVSSTETFCVKTYSLPSGIEIGASGIVLDCRGIELMGTGSGTGIYNRIYDNVVIKNCNVKNYQYGILLSYDGYNPAANNIVENNVLSENQYGIYTSSGSSDSYNTLIGNTITKSQRGIVAYSRYDNITQNILTHSTEYGIYLGGSYNDVAQNIIENSTLYGIYVRSTGGYNNIWDNDIFNTGIWYEATYYNKYCIDEVGNRYHDGAEGPTCSCIPLLDGLIINSIETFCVRSYSLPSGIEIVGNDIVLDCNGAELVGSGTGVGIYNKMYDNVVIKNCNVKNYQYGILLSYDGYNPAANNIVENNVLSDLRYGIYTSGCSKNNYNTIGHNTIRNSQRGIYVAASYSNDITQNAITNSEHGIYLYNSQYNQIRQNIISNNDNGVYIRSSIGNNVTYNDLLENTCDLYNDQNNDISAEYNWWGTVNILEINSSIYDFYDDPSLGIVDFEPFLEAPVYYIFPDWLFNLSITLDSLDKGNRYLGLFRNASDFYDEDIDDLAPPPEMSGFDVFFANNQASPLDRLSKDTKAFILNKNWTLFITAPKQKTVEVSWNSSGIPNNLDLSMVELDELLQPVGTPCDMKNQTSITVQGGLFAPVTKRYRISSIKIAFTETYNFVTGWNFISTPFDVSPFSIDQIFGDQIIGSVWGWDGQKYINVSHIQPKKAYWVAVDHDFSLNMTGHLVYDLLIPLSAGWNMLGVMKPIPVPLPSPVSGSAWTWDGEKYVEEPDALVPKIGYWVAATLDTTIPFSASSANSKGYDFSTEEYDYSITMSLALDGIDKGIRIVGIHQDATDSFDQGIDDLAPPPEMSGFDSYFYEEEPVPKDRLSKDIKALENNKNWIFVVVAPKQQTVEVSWNPLSISDDLNVSMVELDEFGQPVGTPFDMKEQNSITVVGGEFTPTTGVYGINMNISLRHDVAIKLVTSSKTVVGEGYSVKIDVTVTNLGTYTETFNVTAYYNDTAITLPNGKNYTTITLTSGNSTTVTFTWNTTGVAKGNYTIKAKATPVPGEAHTADNTLTDGWVCVTIAGDIDGDYDVDYRDLFLLARAYGSSIGQPGYNPNADLDCSGRIDYRDLFILARNYGKKDP